MRLEVELISLVAQWFAGHLFVLPNDPFTAPDRDRMAPSIPFGLMSINLARAVAKGVNRPDRERVEIQRQHLRLAGLATVAIAERADEIEIGADDRS